MILLDTNICIYMHQRQTVRNRQALEMFLAPLALLPFDAPAGDMPEA